MWERCPLCPSRGKPECDQKYVVPGVGDPDADTMCVLEGPGRQENNMHRPAVGKTGDELDGTYFLLAGIRRDDIWLTNAFKCHWADSSDTPSPDVIQSCADFHLRAEMDRIRPRLVVLMGGIANRLAGLDVDMEHGFLHPKRDFLGWTCDVFSTYHPALGMHKSSAMLALLDDFRAIREQRTVPPDRYPSPRFKRLTTAREVKQEIGNWYDEDLAVDTESIKGWKGFVSTIRYTPWCATFCLAPGSAFLVRVSDTGVWLEFCKQVARRKRKKLIMHNADHDMAVLSGAGCELEWDQVTDTMQIAYQDGRLPKGLKALGYRLLGSRMRDFDSVVRPYGIDLAMDYLGNAALENWPEPVQETTGVWEDKNCETCGGKAWITKRKHLAMALGLEAKQVKCKEPNAHLSCTDCKNGKVRVERMTRKQGVGQKLNRLITDLVKNPETDIWERWNGWADSNPADIHSLVAKLGAIPLPSIDQVPEDLTVDYACGDAHNTFRIAPILRARTAEIRRRVRD